MPTQPQSTHSGPAVEVTDLTVAYGDHPVLWDVDVTVPPATLMAVVGPNGAGKTTLIKAILGLTPIAAGQVLMRNRELLTMDEAALTATSRAVAAQTWQRYWAMF
jgi:ABC-type Mn2+/Zn2+ transport system ATPase subunit